MLPDTLSRIEKKLKDSAIPPEKKTELLKLFANLKTEITELAKTKQEQSESIAGFTHISAHEAVRQKQNPQLLKLSLEGLISSVKEFEASHPKLADSVNRICSILSNLGI